MKTFFLIVPIICLYAVTGGCGKSDVEQKDILPEVAASFEEMFDRPKSRGQELYSRYCSVCHGLTGEGDGFNAYNLDPKPRTFTDSAFVARLDSTLIVEAIINGGGAVGFSAKMPPWGNTLTREDIELVASHVIRLSQSSSD